MRSNAFEVARNKTTGPKRIQKGFFDCARRFTTGLWVGVPVIFRNVSWKIPEVKMVVYRREFLATFHENFPVVKMVLHLDLPQGHKHTPLAEIMCRAENKLSPGNMGST